MHYTKRICNIYRQVYSNQSQRSREKINEEQKPGNTIKIISHNIPTDSNFILQYPNKFKFDIVKSSLYYVHIFG